MKDWDSAQYLKFEAERTQPSRDLAASIPPVDARRVLDAGCGPGNSTRVLAGAFPGAQIVGADSSPAMLEAAKKELPDVRFVACDLSDGLAELGAGYDIVFSNACLQWVPDHAALIPRLYALLAPGGVLAVQVPMQSRLHIHTIIGEESQKPPFSQYINHKRVFYTLEDLQYVDLLAALGAEYRVWKTTYYHMMSGHADILEWYRGTGLRPYLAALPEDLHPAFENAILQRVCAAYPVQKNGQVAFPFPRFFFTAQKLKNT